MPLYNFIPVRTRVLQLASRSPVLVACLSTSRSQCTRLGGRASATPTSVTPNASLAPRKDAKDTFLPPLKHTKKTYSRTWRPSDLSLQHLSDPAKLAVSTARLIRSGERDKALELVRTASKDRPSTVSWNHIINDYMQNGKVQSGFQFFNEMRKRGQKPDSHTYTILFRGLTENIEKTPTAVERALTLLNAMKSPTAPVAPNNIHINAALEVCAKARDLDSIYAIIGALPEEGPGSPDHVTYTLLLNCLAAVGARKPDMQSFGEADVVRMRQQAILQGKRIWANILERWKRRKLTMDEHLMSAMGNLLLLGDVRNHDEVLSLVEQTTQLPREVPIIGDPKRETHLLTRGPMIKDKILTNREPRAETEALDQVGAEPETMLSPEQEEDLASLAPDIESQKLFATDPAIQSLRTYAVPRNRTLSILMVACRRMNALAASQKYWGIITSKIAPNLDNFHEYLRVLRKQRASRLAVEILQQICTPLDQGGFGLTPKPTTFRLAMSVCSRDGNNPNCLQHARKILTLQGEHINVPDVRTGQFLVDMMKLRMGQWPVEEVMATMDSLDALWTNLKSFTAYGNGELTRNNPINREVSIGTRREMASLTLNYYRLIDVAMGHYRERIDTKTFEIWNNRLYRNSNKITRMKKLSRQAWWFDQISTEAKIAADGSASSLPSTWERTKNEADGEAVPSIANRS